MSKEKINTKELRDRILKGIEIAIKKLIAKEQKEGGELIISKDGKIIRVNAKDFTI
ncbi:MAG: hypothetical protein V1781_02115 [Bacteroidota bacterium]